MDLGIVHELKKGTFQPVYVIYGEETYLAERILNAMKETMLHPDWTGLNLTMMDLLKEPLERAVEEALTFPFGEGRRLVIAKNAFFLTGSQVRSSVEHNTDALISYLDNPSDFSSLVLIVPNNKLDERKKVVKTLLQKAAVISVQPPGPEEWHNWVKDNVKEKGILLDQDAFEYLLLYLPTDMRMAEQELEKLSLYAGSFPSRRIGLDELKVLLSRTTEGDVFTLVEKVVQRDFKGAYEIFAELMKQNEEPIKILALLARQLRIILQAKVLSAQGYTQKQIASRLKLHPYPVKLALQQGRFFREEELMELIAHLSELDYQMKTGQVEKRLGLELFLLKMNQADKKKATR